MPGSDRHSGLVPESYQDLSFRAKRKNLIFEIKDYYLLI